MKIKKLAYITHDYKKLNFTLEKCKSSIESCKTSEQLENCYKFIENIEKNIVCAEHISEYTPAKLFLCRLINHDTRHKDFIDTVYDNFNGLKLLINQKLAALLII